MTKPVPDLVKGTLCPRCNGIGLVGEDKRCPVCRGMGYVRPIDALANDAQALGIYEDDK